jgi:predicted dienelactone hydrolase
MSSLPRIHSASLVPPALLGVAFVALALASLAASAPARAAEPAQTTRADGQAVPLQVYEPSSAPCLPLALVSHGAGGSEKGYAYLAEGLAALGWRVVVMGHAESGRQALRVNRRQQGFKAGLASTAQDAQALASRLSDISAALDWAQNRCPAPGQPPRRLLLGHSMGATTVNLEAGARNQVGVQGTDRFDAYVALSPQGVGTVFPPDAWSHLRKPFLQITGTEDQGLEGGPEAREQAFENMPPGCSWLAVIEGATHMHFAGRGLGSRRVEALTLGIVRDFLTASRLPACPRPAEGGALQGVSLRAK